MKLQWTELAFQRALEAVEHIRQENPAAAQAWLVELFRKVDRLEKFPDSGRVVPELGKQEFRELLYKEYRVVYRHEARRISIVTVRHGRRLLDVRELKRPK